MSNYLNLYLRELAISILPDYSVDSFISDLRFVGHVLNIAIFHELYYTFIYCLLPEYELLPKNIQKPFFKRIDDVVFTLTGSLLTAISNIIKRILFIPVALLLSLFSLVDFTIHFLLFLTAISLALLFNVFYVLVNNITIHIFIIGLVNNTLILTTTLLFALIDDAAYRRLGIALTGIYSSLHSLLILIGNALLHSPSLLLGTHYLSLSDPNPKEESAASCNLEEEQLLQMTSTEENNYVLGINCNIINSFAEFYNVLASRVIETFKGIFFTISVPAFFFTEALTLIVLSCCSTIKLFMSAPLLLRSLLDSVFNTDKPKPIKPDALLLNELRAIHLDQYLHTQNAKSSNEENISREPASSASPGS